MDNNITMEKSEKDNNISKQPDINTITITDENTALNVMISFLHMAQKRGAFNMQESAKVWAVSYTHLTLPTICSV